MTRNEVIKMMMVITEGWKGFEVSDAKVAIWHDLLKDLKFEAVLAGLKRLMSSGSSFAPSISEIRKEAVLLTLPSDFRLDLPSAWEEVRRAMKFYGPDQEDEALACLSLLAKKTVQSLGWSRLFYDEPEVIRAHFIRFFTEVRDNAFKELSSPPELRLSPPEQKALGRPKNRVVEDVSPEERERMFEEGAKKMAEIKKKIKELAEGKTV